ncbi:Protein CBG26844 [Caenorhabditis briggsae]|uniref:Protein CBG26844 n=2 Tax=Caenorhabditis briggsae TaxID=6238 RepID=B6ILR8_CAEBR|nr:Protein CBG26844 [Caenorhabditis briggsae]ULU02417.1 hypothetical protein L3Y34_002187 [Caenorhabditis briggsae]CAS00848.1 Protein CBG26844 [Caenorhabditis briggsae]
MANEDRLTHYLRVRTLLKEGKLTYWMPGDDMLWHYVPGSIKMADQIRGWNFYTDPEKQISYDAQMEQRYLQKFRYRDLVTPEADAAHTNDLPMFQPDEMDLVEDIADEIDYARFQRIPLNRRGDGITYVTPFNQRQRLRHRKSEEREERKKQLQQDGNHNQAEIEYELVIKLPIRQTIIKHRIQYDESNSSDGWGQTEYLIDGWEIGNNIPQQPQVQVSTNGTSSSSKSTADTEAKKDKECTSDAEKAQASHSSEEKGEIPVPPATIPKPPIIVPKAIPVERFPSTNHMDQNIGSKWQPQIGPI